MKRKSQPKCRLATPVLLRAKACKLTLRSGFKIGGGGGSRTHVFKTVRQIYYKLSRYYVLALACYRQTAYSKLPKSWIILSLFDVTQFFARCRRPISLTSIQSRTWRDLCRQLESLLFNITEPSENLVSFSYWRSELHVNVIVGIYVFLMDI